MKKNMLLPKTRRELKFRDITNILKQYKWSIFIIVLLSVMISYVYIYFKPSIYNSYSIIKVKTNKPGQSEDVINSTRSIGGTKEVLEEITLLKTFKINKRSLHDINFNIQYFVDSGYKKIELFGESLPIEINNIKILDKSIIGRMFSITPGEKGYTLSYKVPYKAKIKKLFFKTDELNLTRTKYMNYNEVISNPYFELEVKKKAEFTKPIYFILHGNKRDIFEHMIHDRLDILQLEHDTSLIKINFQDTIPERANLYVNALTKSFIDYSIESKNAQNSKTLNFIIEELENIKEELKKSEEKLERQQIAKNIVKPSREAAIYIQNLSNIEIKISENKLKKKLILNLIQFVQNNNNDLDTIAPSVSRLNDDNTLDLIKKLQENKILEEELTLEYTDEFPRLKTIRQQMSTVRGQIEYNLKSLHTNIDYENANLLKQKKSYERDMKKLPSKERELINIKRNYEVKSKMYEYLLKKQAENKIIQLATFSDYQIIDHAYCSNIPIKPKRSLIMLLSIFLGLLLGSVLSFIRHSRNNYIQNKDDIEQSTSLPLYGSIPYFKQPANQVHVHKEVKLPFSESFRTLRTNLQFMRKEDKGTIILLTSTIANEGKSTISANLSTIFEMAKYKTIVINFDLRKPSLHKFFDVPNEKGVSSFLNGRHSIKEIIQSTEFGNLDIIPSGPIPLDPSELILSKEIPKLFEELKKIYEYIIIDTAPIGIVSDTKTLMKYTDLNLIIIREDYAKKDFILTLEEMVEKHQFENIGLILNASKAKGGEYGYGYSYEYKYK